MGAASISSSALPWVLLTLVPACLYSGALPLVGPSDRAKVDEGLTRTLSSPYGAAEVVFLHFLQSSQLLFFLDHRVPQSVPRSSCTPNHMDSKSSVRPGLSLHGPPPAYDTTESSFVVASVIFAC